MDERKAFEAWAGKRERASTTSAWDYAFKAWQAATAAERERAATLCEGLSGRSFEFDMGRLHCAAAIRKGQ